MRIKRFFAPDMRRAIHMVRSEHGPEAVILSSRSVDGGIEIVSALDYDESLVAQVTRRSGISAHAGEGRVDASTAGRHPTAQTAGGGVSTDRDTSSGDSADHDAGGVPGEGRPAARIEWSPDPTLRAMQDELKTLKGMLREQFAHLSWADLKTFQPERAALRRRVDEIGLEPVLADVLVKEVQHLEEPVKAWRELVLALGRRIRVSKTDPTDDGGVIALVGPTGVGKTTTVAKLAARHCLRHGTESLALISTDNYRIAAQRQLDAFGAILGVPVRRADTAGELARLLDRLSDKRLVLIDTAGMAPRDCRLSEALDTLSAPSIRKYVVLAANMQASVMRDAVRRFGGKTLAGTALTKLDEANGLGAALSVLITERLRATWLSEGQRVPEDLKMARVFHLISWTAQPPDLPDTDQVAKRLAASEEMSCAS